MHYWQVSFKKTLPKSDELVTVPFSMHVNLAPITIVTITMATLL